ncbi:MAG TPA: Crp/Fnr family transcriptional regulator, partial [Gemmataceae bacterium]|nr:Crp/Fnr family transcriptional regulator [Gemmataceae bacterium]
GQPVYFPISGVYSLLLPMRDGEHVEVAVVDSEGMLGVPVVLGIDSHTLQALAQVPGECVRVPPDRFFSVLRNGGMLDSLVRRFLAVSWQTANQNIACALRHTVRHRTCRWLLSVHDRAGTDEFEITREVLAEMVGASRQQVTVVTGRLRTDGLITYQRGRVRVTDRTGLEEASCECYRVLKTAYQVLTT